MIGESGQGIRLLHLIIDIMRKESQSFYNLFLDDSL